MYLIHSNLERYYIGCPMSDYWVCVNVKFRKVQTILNLVVYLKEGIGQ